MASILASYGMRSCRVAIAKRPLIRSTRLFKQRIGHVPLGLSTITTKAPSTSTSTSTSKKPPKLTRIKSHFLVEEEKLPDYKAEHYYPVEIGQVFNDCYKIIRKLGYGTQSTVWLCRDMRKEKEYVVLKVYINCLPENWELLTYQHLNKTKLEHVGRNYVRKFHESFEIDGPYGKHICLVLQPMGVSLAMIQKVYPDGICPPLSVRWDFRYLLEGLRFLHDAHIIHTDIQPSNLLPGIHDISILPKFERSEAEDPSMRKEIDGRKIYMSQFLVANGPPGISDLSEARFGDSENTDIIMPEVYRAPEVMLGMPWSYPVDTWALGMTIWHLLEGKPLFQERGPDGKFSEEYQLAKMVAILGPPPLDFLQRSKGTKEFWNEDGTWKGSAPIPETSLETSDTQFEGEEKKNFMIFMRKMLQWKPEDRSDCKGIYDDEWLFADLLASGKAVRN